MFIKIVPFVLASFLLFNLPCFAALTASQQMSGQFRASEIQQEQNELLKQIQRPLKKAKTKSTAKKVVSKIAVPRKVFIKRIHVQGVTLFAAAKIRAITVGYENKELTLSEIHQITNRITQLYRENGYVLSRAYIPPQKINQGVLEIKVLEAKVGNITLKGNRFYSTRLIEGYITLKKGGPFEYTALKSDLEYINDHPDRIVKSTLAPGQEPGTTDIIFKEKDSLPVHVQLGYNNYLSRFLGRNIYTSTFIDNNLLGRDDILTVDYERADANDYYSYETSYDYPVTKTLDLGVHVSRSHEVLGGSFAGANAHGTSNMYGIFGNQKLIRNELLDLGLNFGFDYMDVYNYLNGAISSQDRLRVANTGFNLDLNDDYGRTVVADNLSYGIPDLWGGTPEDVGPSEVPTSRAGAGGEFALDTLNVIRLQALPYDATLLWRNQFQFSSSKLTSTEQYQIGGPGNNRGYPVAEYVGDQGYSMNWDLSQPLYFLPRAWKLPFTKTSFYSAVRLVEFYDWSNVHLNSLQPGDKKNKTLRSAGCGIRVNITQDFSANYQIGWPLTGRSTDGKGVQQWINVTVTF